MFTLIIASSKSALDMPIGCVSVTHEIFLYYAKMEPEAVNAPQSLLPTLLLTACGSNR